MTALRIGLVGAGHIARAHLEAWRRAPGTTLNGVFDVDPGAAARRAREFGIDARYDELPRLIEACDVLDVCTPPGTHAEIAGQVIAAGKHLLIEKPIVTRLAEWSRLSDLAATTRSRIAVLHNLKFAGAVRRCKGWLDEGRVGRPLRLTRHFLTDPTTDRMLGGGGHWSHALPGGRWFETLPHELYLIHHLVGPLELAHVEALSTAAAPGGVPADEVAILFAGGGCLADVHYSANCRLNRRQLVVQGTDGVVTVDILSDVAVLSTGRDARWRRAGGGLLELGGSLVRRLPDRARYLADRLRRRTPHGELIAAFARHLLDEGPSPTPLEEIDYVVRNAERIGLEIDRQVGRASSA